MINKIKVGIVGYGFTDIALNEWLKQINPDVKTLVSDPPKGINDDISDCDAYFIQIYVPTEEDSIQDLTLMKQLIAKASANRPI